MKFSIGIFPRRSCQNSAVVTEPPYLDSHCHLAMADYAADADAVIARARAAGVGEMLVVSATSDDFAAVADFSAEKKMRCAVGLHPHEAKHWAEAEPKLREVWARPGVDLVGEIGLDYFYEHSPREAQRAAFAAQLEAAARMKKRVSIHTRGAAADTLAILTEHAPALPPGPPGVIHCFTDAPATAEALLELGFLISFSGILTFKKSENVRAAARVVPDDRLLYETDAPFLAPEPHRGKRNEPCHAPLVLRRLAELRGGPVEALAAVTRGNFRRLTA